MKVNLSDNICVIKANLDKVLVAPKLSKTTTLTLLSDSKYLTICYPIKPAPPVTKNLSIITPFFFYLE